MRNDTHKPPRHAVPTTYKTFFIFKFERWGANSVTRGAIFMQLWQCFNRLWQYFLVFGKILSMLLVYFSCYSVGANIIAGKWPPNIEWEMYSASHLVTLRVRTKKQNKYPNICPSSHQLFNCRKLRAIFPEQSSLRKEGPTTEGLPTRTICIETFLIGPFPASCNLIFVF